MSTEAATHVTSEMGETSETILAGGSRFEACAEFRSSPDELLICSCGWLEDDHGELAAVRVRRRRRGAAVAVPARKAS